METIKLNSDREYISQDISASVREALSGDGLICHIFWRHYPYCSVSVFGLPDINHAELAIAAYLESCKRKYGEAK